MARPKTKIELFEQSTDKFNEMNLLISKMTDLELNTPFNFSNSSEKEAHWKRDKNIKDILIHLYEWHNLILNWVKSNKQGIEKKFLPEPYNWRNYGDMNIEFNIKHDKTSLEEAVALLNESHKEVMKLAKEFTDEELFSKNVYKWVGGTCLGSYFVSSMSSHYNWAIKKIKKHKKNLK